MPDQIFRVFVFLGLTFGFSLLGCLILAVLFNGRGPGNRFEYFITAVVVGVCFVVAAPIGLGAFGIPPTKNNLLVFLFFSLAFLASLFVIRIVRRVPVLPAFPSEDRGFYLLGGFYLILIVVRAVQLNDIFVPNWVDGLIHTQLLERLEVSEKISFGRIYHVGFHAGALWVYYFFGLSLPDAILLFGQWLSATCGVTFYLVVRRYVRGFYFSLLSLVIYSLFLLFPSFLISWGRYPFLLGLTILPLSVTTGWDWVSGRRKNFFFAFFLVLTLVMVHYGTLVIWFSFILVNMAYQWVIIGKQKGNWIFAGWPLLGRFLLLILPLSIFGLPKLANLLEHKEILANMALRAANVSFVDDFVSVFRLVFSHDYFLASFVVVGVIISSIWKKRLFWIVLSWPVLVGGLIWMQYLLLGLSISSYSNLVIFLSMPFAILSGLVIKYLSSLDRSLTNLDAALGWKWPMVLILVVALFGAWSNLTIVDPSTILFSPADHLAMTWIRENTSDDSVFLVESFLWGNKLMPFDGGGWIGLLTGRGVIYPRQIGDLYDMCVFIRDHHIDYIYLRDEIYEDNFGLRLSDFSGEYEIVYSDGPVLIVSVMCP